MDDRLNGTVLEQLATLSKLEITDAGKTELCQNLEQLLAYVTKISELSTDDILPLTHFPECTCHLDDSIQPAAALLPPIPEHHQGTPIPGLREDTPCPDTNPELLTALAPTRIDSYYIVPGTFQSN